MTIGIIGLGAMGLGIAQVFAQAGHEVRATDAVEGARTSARDLGLESLFTGFLPKPHVMLDDQLPQQWPNCIVVVPAGLASATVEGHLAALAQRERGENAPHDTDRDTNRGGHRDHP